MGYNEKRDEIIDGLSDELFRFLDSTGFKLIETRTGEDCEATFGSKHIIAEALADAMNPFLQKAFELGGNNGGVVCEPKKEKEERIRRPVRFVEGVPPAPKSPKKKATVSEVMLEPGAGSSGILPLDMALQGDLVCRISVEDLSEVAGQAADKFIIGHLQHQGFDLNREIYREGGPLGKEMIYRQRRR